jgi:hypothetical protein
LKPRVPAARIGSIGGPGLSVLFVGINPSLRSAEVGHHFARPGNRFWPALHAAGFTPRLLTTTGAVGSCCRGAAAFEHSL